jgi:PadR family transcriptional regulator PadR
MTEGSDSRLLLLSEQDNVVIARTNLTRGDVLSIDGVQVTLSDGVHLGFKIARCDLSAGQKVLKYPCFADATLCRLTTMGKDRNVRMSLQTLRVLEAFLENPADELSGADVQKRSSLASGTLYPILLRLESAGWFVSRWETIDPSSAGRPRRRLYRLTPGGLTRASEVFASFGRGVPA